ncbi:Glycosyltransferase [Rhodovastum atsumiense]|uniref:Glycosyltransferase n=1 Tax=Rhodovastum atsumiense TaxID=504468 RepID=A0A5M6IIS1_9PROT|nr:glycosyltransferase [Rhodovastum atsumiense]KAA5608171.1 glycosyltransferase [Rhodovastum atsumiense]CAH2600955.1 Glycosyltransferase [Rhodovastum atsumiense]
MIAPALLSLLSWLYLAFLHGRFWQDGERLAPAQPTTAPPVAIIVPARDEAEVIARSIGSLLAQDYPGPFRVVLVDDGSSDDTAAIARALPGAERLTVIAGTPRPADWAGKLWAVQQGVAATEEPLVLLTDADIEHDPTHLATLVAHAGHLGADMVSEMVELSCESPAERVLIPAFPYLFALLYPFAWVNNPLWRTAAAAGGTILIRRHALERIGGIAAIRGALIDDVALAKAVKRGGRIWLGHSRQARSIRPYPGPGEIWGMIARSAYVQLGYSPLMLALSLLGLTLVFLVPPLAVLTGSWVAKGIGLAAWAIMARSFWPTLHRFRLSPLWTPVLPAVALFYMAATIGSAINHHRGRGVVWKRRAYTGQQA